MICFIHCILVTGTADMYDVGLPQAPLTHCFNGSATSCQPSIVATVCLRVVSALFVDALLVVMAVCYFWFFFLIYEDSSW
jgi:hypothetical protein